MGFVLTLMGLIPGPAGGLPGKRCHLSLGPQRGRQKGRGEPCSAPLCLMAAANPIANDQEQGGALTAPRHVAGSCSSGRPPAPRPFLQGCPPARDRPCTHRAQRSAIPALRPLPLRFLPETVPRFCGAAPLGRAGRAPGRRRPGKAELPAPLLLSALMPWASQHQCVPSPGASTTPPRAAFLTRNTERGRERGVDAGNLYCARHGRRSGQRAGAGASEAGCGVSGGQRIFSRAWLLVAQAPAVRQCGSGGLGPWAPQALKGPALAAENRRGGRESGRAEGRPGARPWPWRKEE